ncbi:MAG: hypothetical protein QW063_01535 [Candidatus Nanoarchaeia archaeon]
MAKMMENLEKIMNNTEMHIAGINKRLLYTLEYQSSTNIFCYIPPTQSNNGIFSCNFADKLLILVIGQPAFDLHYSILDKKSSNSSFSWQTIYRGFGTQKSTLNADEAYRNFTSKIDKLANKIPSCTNIVKFYTIFQESNEYLKELEAQLEKLVEEGRISKEKRNEILNEAKNYRSKKIRQKETWAICGNSLQKIENNL